MSYPTPPLPPSHRPRLGKTEWIVFAVLAAIIAGANIYTTLLIGWGDTGSIIAVLAAVVLLGLLGKRKPDIYTLNLGQTMVSAGGGVGFAVASYAAVHIVQPDWNPNPWLLTGLFASMGLLGAMVGTTVRKQMVGYFFPSGTACAVIQRAVTRDLKPGEPNRPIRLLKLWSAVAALITLPTKISLVEGGKALLGSIKIPTGLSRLAHVDIATDPLYYGIGLVVGPRVGLGMVLGALAVSLGIIPSLEGGALEAETGDWIKWIAIAVLTLPTFATIVFAYIYRTPAVVPSGFSPGATVYGEPPARRLVYGSIAIFATFAVCLLAQAIFELPWYASVITIAVAWPLSIVNGRVTGDTDINPVRLVAIVLLSGFFWLVARDAAVLLGMAVVGATIASVAVDMMQDYRTGYLVDQDPAHQTSVQLVGAIMGAIASVPVLHLLIGRLGLGEGSSLPAPGAQVWATMAKAMTEGFNPSSDLLWAIGIVSLLGSVYAYFTVWPKTAPWMPSIFGVGIGMLIGMEGSAAIFLGGFLRWVVIARYTRGKRGEELADASESASNDTMLAGASVFAAGAVLSILLVLVVTAFDQFGWHPFWIAH